MALALVLMVLALLTSLEKFLSESILSQLLVMLYRLF